MVPELLAPTLGQRLALGRAGIEETVGPGQGDTAVEQALQRHWHADGTPVPKGVAPLGKARVAVLGREQLEAPFARHVEKTEQRLGVSLRPCHHVLEGQH